MPTRLLDPLVLPLLLAALLSCSTLPGAPSTPPAGLDPDLVQRGARLFADPRLSGDGSRSCASCHPGGLADQRVWVRGQPALPGSEGARRTRSVRGVWQSAPYFWDGSAATLRAAIERMLEVEMSRAPLPPHDLAALETYLLSLAPFDRGRVRGDGSPTEPVSLAALRGWGVFRRARCSSCHPPGAYLVPRPADVGTGGPIDVPSLRGVGSRPPYGHDGRWPDLGAAIASMLESQSLNLTGVERGQLEEYLKLL